MLWPRLPAAELRSLRCLAWCSAQEPGEAKHKALLCADGALKTGTERITAINLHAGRPALAAVRTGWLSGAACGAGQPRRALLGRGRSVLLRAGGEQP